MKELHISTEGSDKDLWTSLMEVIQDYGYSPKISIATLGACIESINDAENKGLIQKNRTIKDN